ncbi:MAG: hypothetical protein WC716_00625 [Chitinophagaceae bacterium]|jgi:uncharacterized protein involved in exopolysaccharide biosynthesis
MTQLSSDYSLMQLKDILPARKWFVVRLTLLCALLGVAGYFIFPNRYKAEIVFVLKNPMFSDRGSIYSEPKNLNYFANEDEITRFISMANLDSLKMVVIKKFNLIDAYHLNAEKEKDQERALELFSKSLVVYKAESNEIVLLYADKNAHRAAEITNFYVPMIEHTYREIYNEMRLSVCRSIKAKIVEQDSAITALTDSLILLRDKFKIYDVINPSRHNIMSGAMSSQGRPDFATGIEKIQNIEAIKDEFVSDRSYKMTLLNQYTTGNPVNMNSLIKIIKPAHVPLKREGIGLKGMVFICTFFGFFISLFYVIAKARIEKL